MTRNATIALLSLLVAVASAPARAQGAPVSGNDARTSGVSALDDSVRAVASMLRCPICQGESIQESPSDLAKAMRQVVREQISAGRSTEEVKAYFVSKYGEWILLQPKAHGVNLTVYLLPFAVIVGGGLLIVFAIRRWMLPSRATQPDSPPVE